MGNGCPCCGAQNFCAALRRPLEILTAATRSPRFICHRQRSARSPHQCAHWFAMTGQEVRRGTRRATWGPPYRMVLESVRRGRCPHRPATVDAGFIPVPPHERGAEIDAESIRKQGLVCNIRLRKVKIADDFTPICAKDSKTIGFGGVLWVLSFAEERKYPAGGKERIATPVTSVTGSQ